MTEKTEQQLPQQWPFALLQWLRDGTDAKVAYRFLLSIQSVLFMGEGKRASRRTDPESAVAETRAAPFQVDVTCKQETTIKSSIELIVLF